MAQQGAPPPRAVQVGHVVVATRPLGLEEHVAHRLRQRLEVALAAARQMQRDPVRTGAADEHRMVLQAAVRLDHAWAAPRQGRIVPAQVEVGAQFQRALRAGEQRPLHQRRIAAVRHQHATLDDRAVDFIRPHRQHAFQSELAQPCARHGGNLGPLRTPAQNEALPVRLQYLIERWHEHMAATGP